MRRTLRTSCAYFIATHIPWLSSKWMGVFIVSGFVSFNSIQFRLNWKFWSNSNRWAVTALLPPLIALACIPNHASWFLFLDLCDVVLRHASRTSSNQQFIKLTSVCNAFVLSRQQCSWNVLSQSPYQHWSLIIFHHLLDTEDHVYQVSNTDTAGMLKICGSRDSLFVDFIIFFIIFQFVFNLYLQYIQFG